MQPDSFGEAQRELRAHRQQAADLFVCFAPMGERLVCKSELHQLMDSWSTEQLREEFTLYLSGDDASSSTNTTSICTSFSSSRVNTTSGNSRPS